MILAFALALTDPPLTLPQDAVAAEAPASVFAAAPASTERLAEETARENLTVVAQSQQAATVANNSVNGTSTTGSAAVSDQAFQNASGLTLVNINTGNNVAMNASMNVNVVVNPQQ